MKIFYLNIWKVENFKLTLSYTNAINMINTVEQFEIVVIVIWSLVGITLFGTGIYSLFFENKK